MGMVATLQFSLSWCTRNWSTINYTMVYESRFKPRIYLSQSPSKCSIVLNNVFKTHNDRNIFDGVNLTAHSGKICAILGEINSGKSMLLSCLVGGDKIDKGHIWVLGGKPRTKSSKTLTKYTGYMPQEFCLYKTMTVLELFKYFGNLYNINYKFILWRISYYKDIFTLPPINSTIQKLSFSEKRMISFIISVFHRPRLVVLDEPTIGLDVLKKNQIWRYLYHVITTWKPTVVVATNNIEEAFLATKIAYLKNGKIIFEREVEELHRTNPNKSIDLIIEDLYTNKNSWINSNLSKTPRNKKLSICKKINPRSNIWKFKTTIIQNMKFLTSNIWI
ncbi:ABC transporter G family member 23-like [Metopolophium dirhodum]|uniref:ABC transporter G family member 23-like n=1 Tax=Metopolophium dirhodum TaxID=44670 RepID=UPI00298FBFBF|nr:ABC transporter G family member 23-like [Metopolophium dirhodum]